MGILKCFPAKPGKWLQPSSTKAGHEATGLCAETAEKDTGLYAIPAAAAGRKKWLERKKEVTPAITTGKAT